MKTLLSYITIAFLNLFLLLLSLNAANVNSLTRDCSFLSHIGPFSDVIKKCVLKLATGLTGPGWEIPGDFWSKACGKPSMRRKGTSIECNAIVYLLVPASFVC